MTDIHDDKEQRPTPRTDALLNEDGFGGRMGISQPARAPVMAAKLADHARQLERDLAERDEECLSLSKQVQSLDAKCAEYEQAARPSLAAPEGESRWLVERTYAPGFNRQYWTGAQTSPLASWDHYKGDPVWTDDPLEAARYATRDIAYTLRLHNFHPERPVDVCEHLFQCGTTAPSPRATPEPKPRSVEEIVAHWKDRMPYPDSPTSEWDVMNLANAYESLLAATARSHTAQDAEAKALFDTNAKGYHTKTPWDDLAEETRQLWRDEAAKRRSHTEQPDWEYAFRELLANCGRGKETDEAVERARAFLLKHRAPVGNNSLTEQHKRESYVPSSTAPINTPLTKHIDAMHEAVLDTDACRRPAAHLFDTWWKLKGELEKLAVQSARATPTIDLILAEVAAARAKHPGWPDADTLFAAAIVAEESGELMRAAVQHKGEGGSLEACDKEAIQTAAVAIRFIERA